MTISELDNMSLKDLRAFRDRVDDAIRAAIARDRMARTARVDQHDKIDLERERDAWKAMRRQA